MWALRNGDFSFMSLVSSADHCVKSAGATSRRSTFLILPHALHANRARHTASATVRRKRMCVSQKDASVLGVLREVTRWASGIQREQGQSPWIRACHRVLLHAVHQLLNERRDQEQQHAGNHQRPEAEGVARERG